MKNWTIFSLSAGASQVRGSCCVRAGAVLRRAAFAAGIVASILGSASAFAGWGEQGSVYTSRGEYSGTRETSCGAGNCTRTGRILGGSGRSATNSNTISRTAPGQFSDSGTATGSNGRSVQHAGDTSCANGTCSHTGTGTVTGPDGRSTTTSDSLTRDARGQYSSSATINGPNGNTVNHSSALNCAGTSCSRSGTVSGPNGGAVPHSGNAALVAPGVDASSGSVSTHEGTVETVRTTVVVGGAPVAPTPLPVIVASPPAQVLVAPPPVVVVPQPAQIVIGRAPVMVVPPPAPVVVATPAVAVALPSAAVIVVPSHASVWVPGHWVGALWERGHWS